MTSDLVVGSDGNARCRWCEPHDDYREYHDLEWGVAPTNDLEWFEKVSLEGFQAGLSWITILRRRDRFREVFEGFDPNVVARFGDADISRLLGDAGIIRHEGKIRAVINNASRAIELLDECGTLGAYFERFREPDMHAPLALSEVPASTPTSTRLSRDLRRRGWKFVGPTTMYAMGQSMGLVNDHLVGCWRRGLS
jgi:DNA-3-methyladenine glycosylase I